MKIFINKNRILNEQLIIHSYKYLKFSRAIKYYNLLTTFILYVRNYILIDQNSQRYCLVLNLKQKMLILVQKGKKNI